MYREQVRHHYANSYPNGNSYAYTYTYTDTNRNSYAYSYTYADTNTYSHTDSDTNRDAYTYSLPNDQSGLWRFLYCTGRLSKRTLMCQQQMYSHRMSER